MLENHHVAATFQTLMDEDVNILAGFDCADKNAFRLPPRMLSEQHMHKAHTWFVLAYSPFLAQHELICLAAILGVRLCLRHGLC